ncbi:MAG: hypothetical protein LQ351_005659 [Letrouitia transgressa]|nr:MAG: hypothetical protein LQ351_005659 [Letrouitia transgressa]
MEDAETWSPYTDVGMGEAHSQPSRTRTIALQISSLCEISADLLGYFYHPTYIEKRPGKQAELKKLSELHTRLEAWRKNLPKELEPKEGQLPSVLIMHMFFQLLFIHLFRPFLRYKQANSPLPSHVSPRRFCTHAAAIISKLLRLYKRTHGLRQIVNLAVYITHTACTIHLLNLPEKNAIRDLIHGVKHLEEIAEGWLCARKALGILHIVSRKWNIELPEEASKLLERTDIKFGTVQASNGFTSPKSENAIPASSASSYCTATTQQHHPNQHPQPHQHPTHGRPHPRPRPHPHHHLQHQPIANPSNPAPAFNPIASNGFFNATGAITPQSTPEVAAAHTPSSVITLPPQSAAELAHKSRQQSFVLPKAQQELWNRHRASRGTASDSRTSPSALFGGVDSLVEMEEGQDYWLQRDMGSFFENWNREYEGMEMRFNGNGDLNAGAGYLMPGFGGLDGGYD